MARKSSSFYYHSVTSGVFVCIVDAFEQASGVDIPFQIAPRRNGDLSAFWADASKAQEVLMWQAKRSLNTMMADTWRWQSANPNGYN